MNFTKIALKRPVSMFIIIAGLIVFGVMSIIQAPIELTPEMEMPVIMAMTTYIGASPEDVEANVTKHIEDAVSTLSGVKNVISMSQENMSIVALELEYGTDMDVAHMDLQEKLNMYGDLLPDEAGEPMIMEMSMESMPVAILSATATGDLNLLNFMNDTVSPQFEQLGGVASVDVMGGQEDYISIQLMEDRLKQYRLDMSSIAGIVSSADFSMPVGNADHGSQNLAVRGGIKYRTVESLKDIPITLGSGQVIHLSDVAKVFVSQKDAAGINRYNGEDNVGLMVQKRQSASTLDVTKAVTKKMEEINASNVGVQLSMVFDSSEQILSSIRTVFVTLISGVVLCMFVLFLFFGDLRASLIVGSSMPISLLITFIAMRGMGLSINLVSLGGLVIAIGMMVDNSIVVLESCFRQKNDRRLGFYEAAMEGSKFVAMSVAAGTLTTVVVFLPISLIAGMTGQLFKPLGFTIVSALLASLIDSLTLVPMFFLRFKPREKTQIPMNRVMKKLEGGYGRMMRHVLPHKILVSITAVLLLVASFFLFKQLNVELMPQSDQGSVSLEIQARKGLQTEKLREMLIEVEEMVARHPDVDRYSASTSSMSMGGGDASATVTAYLKSGREMSTYEVIEQWQRETKDTVGYTVNVKMSSSGMSTGGGSDIEVAIQGTDYEVLKEVSKDIEGMMTKTDGIIRVTSDVSSGNPQAEVVVDPLKAGAYGFTPAQIVGVLNMTLSGKETVDLTEDGQEYTIYVEYPKDRYKTIDDLRGLVLTAPTGKQVPLMDIAEIEFSDSPQSITRKNNLYQVSVTAQPTEQARFDAKKAIDAAAGEMPFPKGVSLAQSSSDAQMAEEFASLGGAIVTAILLVFMVMAMQFESAKFSLMVMLSIPFSLIGSFGLMYLTNSTVSMVSMMGMLILIGTVVNNGILFIDTANQYRASMDVQTALISAGMTRMRPIFMTTLTTVLSMMPMALGIGEGAETMQGMAVIIIGGLLASTVLTLLLIPSFYLMIDRKPRPPKTRASEVQPEKDLNNLSQEELLLQ